MHSRMKLFFWKKKIVSRTTSSYGTRDEWLPKHTITRYNVSKCMYVHDILLILATTCTCRKLGMTEIEVGNILSFKMNGFC